MPDPQVAQQGLSNLANSIRRSTALESARIRMERRLEDKPNGCKEWTGPPDIGGYGYLYFDGRHHKAHRVAWELANGPIPEGLFVLHRCDNRPCCNPEHLFLGTKKDNTADMYAKGRNSNGRRERTHCPQEHPYDEENTYVDRRGRRYCKECNRRAVAKYRAAKMRR